MFGTNIISDSMENTAAHTESNSSLIKQLNGELELNEIYCALHDAAARFCTVDTLNKSLNKLLKLLL